MSAIETEPAATPAEGAGAESGESRAPENREREPKSSRTRKRRAPPYTRAFRDFLEQLGEGPGQFDAFRHDYWGAIHPEDAFEDDLFEDLVENRWELRRLKSTRQAKLVEIRRRNELKRQQRDSGGDAGRAVVAGRERPHQHVAAGEDAGIGIPAQAGAVVSVEDGQTGRRGGGPPRRKRDWGSELPLGTRWRRAIGGGARVGGSSEGRGAIDGGAQPVSRFMVTTMVKPRTLNRGS